MLVFSDTVMFTSVVYDRIVIGDILCILKLKINQFKN